MADHERGIHDPAAAHDGPDDDGATANRDDPPGRGRDLGYTRFLHGLLEEKANERLRRRIQRLRKQSGLPPSKTFRVIDEARLPEKVRRQLPSLLTGEFIRRGDDLLTLGLPGRGKTLFVAALGCGLITRHQLQILFTPTYNLVFRQWDQIFKAAMTTMAAIDRLVHHATILMHLYMNSPMLYW